MSLNPERGIIYNYRPVKECPPPKRCGDCVRPACQRIEGISKTGKTQEQIPLSTIENLVFNAKGVHFPDR
jgi:hypothetical protein